MRRLVRRRQHGVVLPLEPRLEAWKVEHVPGRAAMRRALGPHHSLGKALRALPVAYTSGGNLFVHAGLLPEWAKLGVSGLAERARNDWATVRDNRLWSLSKRSLFRAAGGPLWDRTLVRGDAGTGARLRETLRLVGAERMIVGHTQTGSLRGGQEGRVSVLSQGRLIAVDVGLAEGEHTPRTALVIDGARGLEWTPNGVRSLWSR
jgi:hypothetical protein